MIEGRVEKVGTILLTSEKVKSDIVYITDGRRSNSRVKDDLKFSNLIELSG